MPIIVEGSGSSPTTTLTATSIVSCTSQDVRSVLGTTGNDATILLDYINRISLELMRHSRWRFLESPVKSFSTTIGENDYFIGLGAAPAGSTDVNLDIENLRSIKEDSVMDRNNERRLGRTEEIPLGTFFDSNGPPKLYRLDQDTGTILSVYPAPDQVYVIDFRYYEAFNTIDDINDNLQIPGDYKDVVCAGVNWLASKYLKEDAAAQHWFSIYQDGKRQIIKDYNLFPRGSEFIGPDTAGVVTRFPLSIDTAGNF